MCINSFYNLFFSFQRILTTALSSMFSQILTVIFHRMVSLSIFWILSPTGYQGIGSTSLGRFSASRRLCLM